MDHQPFLSQHYPNPNPSASMEVMPTSSVLLHLTNPQLMNHNNNNNNEEEEDDEKVKEENRLQQQHFNVNGLMESHDDADLGQLRNPNRLPSEGRSKWENNNNNNNNNNKISCLRTGNMVNNHHIPWTAAGEEEGHCYNGALLEGLTDYIHYSSTGQLIQHHELQKYVHKDSSSLPTSKTHSGPNSHTNDPSSIDIIPSIVDMSGTVNANLVSSSSDSLNLLQRYSPEGPVTATRFSRLGGNMNMHSESFTNVVDRGILFTNGHKNLAQEGHTMVSKCSLPEASILNDHVDHNIITILQTPRKKSNLEIKVTTSSMNESDESNMGTQDVSSSCEKMNNSNGRPLGRKRKAGAKRKCTEEEEERDSFSIKPKDVLETDEAGKLKCKKGDDNISFSAPDGDQYAKVEQCSTSVNSGESTPKSTKENSVKPPDTAPKQDFIHVRARRGQATDSHSLAERVRREKISERMKYLQDLVPGCSKVTGKAVMLDEIINYVQSLQRQVEFLSMKLAVMNPRVAEFNMETVFGHERNIEPSRMAPSAIHFGQENEIPYPNLHPQHEHNAFVGPHPTSLTNATQPTLNAFGNSLSQGWDIGELQSVVQSGFQGQLFPGQMKTEH